MKKYFTINKIGYSTDVYGCSGEYFICVFITPKKQGSFHFKGLYGTEERVEQVMKEKGFEYFYTPNRFGKLKKTNKKSFVTEYEALNIIKKDL